MDKYRQERFFQLLKNTYDRTDATENVSVETVIEQIKSELASFYRKGK